MTLCPQNADFKAPFPPKRNANMGRRWPTAIVAGMFCWLLFVCVDEAKAQTTISIEGWGPEGSETASGGERLEQTRRGQVRIHSEERSWVMLAVSVAVDPLSPEATQQEADDYADLIERFGWLEPRLGETVASVLDNSAEHSIESYVNGADLDLAAQVPIAVWPAAINHLMALSVDLGSPDPDAVKSYAQATFDSSPITWRTQYSTWGGTISEGYWMPTYAHPVLAGQSSPEFNDIHWFRLMESAIIQVANHQEAIVFTRGDWMDLANSFGLHLSVQAVTLKSEAAGPPPPLPPTEPEAVPGLVGVTGTVLPRFTVSLPVTIAIPYTDPKGDTILSPSSITTPYEPGILNMKAAPGTVMFAAIGHTTSATHAIFPTTQGPIASLLFRGPGEGPIAAFVVPAEGVAGEIEFQDLVGENESAKRPMSKAEYDPLD